jgi:hypothetical protein
MSEKEAYIHEWIREVSKQNLELDGFAVCPYASSSKTLIVETPIDDIVPEPGHDVIVFIVEDFWASHQIKNWVNLYNEKFQYYSFFEDLVINRTNYQKFNLILCQSKQKLSKIRKKLEKSESYTYWKEDYLKEILGDDYETVKKEGKSG